MGFFDALFGSNTSAATQAGVAQAQAALAATSAQNDQVLQKTSGQANKALTANLQSGLSALNSDYGSAIGALGAGGAQAQQLLNAGTNAGVASSMAGNDTYQPYVNTGGAASSMLNNVLGLNGPGGNAAAQAAFQASPGYQFQQDQAANQTSRQAAALGLAGSGSTLDAILRGSSNLANTEYQGYLGNLSNASTQGLNAASGISANDRAAGTLQGTAGTTGATLANTNATSVGTAYANQGNASGNLYSTLGQGLSGNYDALGTNTATSNTALALPSAQASITAGQAQDNATNVNNGILSKLIGGVLGTPLGPTSLSGSGSGTTGAPNVGFNLSPFSSSSGANASTFGGALVNGVGNTLKSFF